MDKKPLIVKCLSVGIILLFVGTCSIPSIAQNTEKQSSRGNWLYVGGSGPGNYTRIQDAIDNASDGDTVFVYSGIYPAEWITIDKALILIGENKNTTILDGRSSDNMILLVESSDVTIREFTLENCKDNGMNQAIYLWGNPRLHNIIVSDCIMTNNDKGIFFINVTNLLVSFCTIHHNYAESLWGMNSSDIVVHNCTVNNNGAGGGGGYTPGGVTINWDDVSYLCSTVSITDCDIIANKYWGIAIENTKNVKIYHNNISLNMIGIHFDGTPHLEIYDNVVLNNEWSGIEGTSFIIPPSTDVVIHGNTLSGNGNGAYIQGCSNCVSIKNNNFTFNDVGINAAGADGIVIMNNSLINNTEVGIYLNTGNRCRVRNNTLLNSIYGLHMHCCDVANISRNIISGNDCGINLSDCNNYCHSNSVSGNIITGNGNGIQFYRARNNNISSNILSDNDGIGIIINSSKNNTISKNNIMKNRRDACLLGFMMEISEENHWINNYWNRARILPKVIFGMTQYQIYNHLTGFLPRIEFDWHPAQEPYDIPEMK